MTEPKQADGLEQRAKEFVLPLKGTHIYMPGIMAAFACQLLAEERKRVREELQHNEWEPDGHYHTCTVCRGVRNFKGHSKDCWLAAAIRKLDGGME